MNDDKIRVLMVANSRKTLNKKFKLVVSYLSIRVSLSYKRWLIIANSIASVIALSWVIIELSGNSIYFLLTNLLILEFNFFSKEEKLEKIKKSPKDLVPIY